MLSWRFPTLDTRSRRTKAPRRRSFSRGRGDAAVGGANRESSHGDAAVVGAMDRVAATPWWWQTRIEWRRRRGGSRGDAAAGDADRVVAATLRRETRIE
mmetsp:Transcript_1400/g.4061  ORF Transcript_1400/g.4061 Transcript_1400/m.4061 type:complete len:99 (+) Transcript_1400:678-974(+)